MDSKGCIRCGAVKPMGDFNRSSSRSDGRQAHCRQCAREYRLVRLDEALEREREYRESHRDEIALRDSAYRAANYARIRERATEYAKRNREQNRTSRATRPHVQWVNAYRHRARKLGVSLVEEDFTKADVIARYGNGCFYCESGAFEHLDHYVPISDGGHHTLDNARPSCASCNATKGDLSPDEWARVAPMVAEMRLSVAREGRVGVAANGRRRRPAETVAEVERLTAAGASAVEIVRELGRRSSTVSRALYQMGRSDLARPFTALADMERRAER